MDHFFLAAFIRRKVRFMAKSQLFQPPLQYVYSHGGVFPLRRGHRDEEAFITARAILERGGCVAMYCEGSRSKDGKLSERAQARHRPARARDRRGGRAGRDPRLVEGAQLAQGASSRRSPSSTATRSAGSRSTTPTRDQQMAVAEEIFGEIKVLYSGLETLGRKGVLQRVREQRRLERRGKKRAATA